MCSPAYLQVTQKAASFAQHKRKQVQAALPFGPYSPADPVVLGVSVAEKNTVRIAVQYLRIFFYFYFF